MTLYIEALYGRIRAEFWWCKGLLHKHKSLKVAEKCERERVES